MARRRVSGLKPGESAPASGQYKRIGPRGGVQPGEVTSTRGKPLPPSTARGQTYKLVDETKHKR